MHTWADTSGWEVHPVSKLTPLTTKVMFATLSSTNLIEYVPLLWATVFGKVVMTRGFLESTKNDMFDSAATWLFWIPRNDNE